MQIKNYLPYLLLALLVIAIRFFLPLQEPEAEVEDVETAKPTSVIKTHEQRRDNAVIQKENQPQEDLSEAKIDAASQSIDPNSIDGLIQQSSDLYGLALQLLSSAKAGDAESQYRLYRVLDFCLNDTNENPEELMEYYEFRGVDINIKHLEQTQQNTEKCQSLKSAEPKSFYQKDYSEWLKRASELGYPQAVISKIGGDIRAMRDSDIDSKKKFLKDTYREQLYDAIKSENGQIYRELALISAKIGGQEQAIAWIKVACNRGYNCSLTSLDNWRQASIAYCLDKTKQTDCYEKADLDYLLTNFFDKEKYLTTNQLAEKMEKLIDAGDYDSLMNLFLGTIQN